MSEFSKLSARLDSVSEAVLRIDSNYAVTEFDTSQQAGRNDRAVRSSSDEKSVMDISDIISLSHSSQPSAASQSMSTTSSATPDFRTQWAWRSTSAIVATDKEQYLSVYGKQLIADYDSIQKLRDEMIVKVIPACEQFVLKAAKDALTDTPRYGAVMRAKMTSALERSQSLLEVTGRVIERLGPLLEVESEMRRERMLQAEREVEEKAEKERQMVIEEAAKTAVSTHIMSIVIVIITVIIQQFVNIIISLLSHYKVVTNVA